jgi:hypothetical protein
MSENDVENAPETGCIVLPAFPPWGSQQEAKKQYWRVTDNYDKDGKPAGALGAVPLKKNMNDEGQQLVKDVCARAEAGHYLEIAKQNPTPDRYDEKGILIPPGCIGPTTTRRDRLPPEVLGKIKSGAYVEMAMYKRMLEERANEGK